MMALTDTGASDRVLSPGEGGGEGWSCNGGQIEGLASRQGLLLVRLRFSTRNRGATGPALILFRKCSCADTGLAL